MSPARVHRSLPHRGLVRHGTRPRRADVLGEVAVTLRDAAERIETLARKVATQGAEIDLMRAERAVLIARLDAVERATTGTGRGRV